MVPFHLVHIVLGRGRFVLGNHPVIMTVDEKRDSKDGKTKAPSRNREIPERREVCCERWTFYGPSGQTIDRLPSDSKKARRRFR
jgi:hypothetical protein